MERSEYRDAEIMLVSNGNSFASFRFGAPPPLDAPGARQQRVLNDELAFAPWKWRTANSAGHLAVARPRSGLDFGHLIERIAIRAFEGSER